MKDGKSLIWCSVYYGQCADQLLIIPNELRAKDLSIYHSESIHEKNIRHNIVWLKIPLPTTTVQCSNEQFSPEILNSHINMINLLSILYHIFLPISYEYEPDLICLMIGSNPLECEYFTLDSLAQIIYLINGLGRTVLINGSSLNDLYSMNFLQSLQGKPITTGLHAALPTTPSSR
ncbi:unnamed protein product [Schistosoma turkestanicum]|nr:unnamed protein product [Schistosoma turkestanicum]